MVDLAGWEDSMVVRVIITRRGAMEIMQLGLAASMVVMDAVDGAGVMVIRVALTSMHLWRNVMEWFVLVKTADSKGYLFGF